MFEKINFNFEGSLADKHRLNFYEAARFQYAASRLLVKLSQFRSHGRFNKKISNKSNFDVRLVSQADGSFNINVEDADNTPTDEKFINASLGNLMAYVGERVIEKIDGENLPEEDQLDEPMAVQPKSAIDIMAEEVISEDRAMSSIPKEDANTVKRRIAEISRESMLDESSDSIIKIDFARSQKLIAMSAPLISEMATVLRRSADTLEVSSTSGGRSKTVLFLDQKMAAQIETSIVDDEITALLCDVVQFNKDTGWGKVKIENGAVTVAFSIPYDILTRIRPTLIDTMKRDQVYLQTYFVRDRAGDVIRLIVAGIIPTPII